MFGKNRKFRINEVGMKQLLIEEPTIQLVKCDKEWMARREAWRRHRYNYD